MVVLIMFYQRDFIGLREHTNRIQIFSRRVDKRSEGKLIFQKFAENSSVHGFTYIFNRRLHKFERYLWAFCVVLASILTICICAMLSGKYSDRSLMTVVEDSQYPVFKIDFPAIGVCTRHRINWGRIQLARNKFLPADASNETVETFMRFVRHLDSMEFQKFNQLSDLEGEPLHLIDSLSVSKVALYLAFRCEEILIKGSCMFAGQKFNCCKMFVPEKTKNGICLVFNSVVSPQSKQKAAGDRFYPYKNSKNGEGSGLIFLVRGNISTEIPDGVKNNSGIDLMIKKPDEWTDWKTNHLRVNTNNEIILQPQLTVAHEDLRSFPLSFRRCLFEHEKSTSFFIPDLNYHLLNCKSQCQQDFLIRQCNCTTPLFFSTIGITADECKPSDYLCIYKIRNLFNSVKQARVGKLTVPKEDSDLIDCTCLPSCTSLAFPIILNPMPVHNLSGEALAIRVDIFYQSQVIMRYLTTLKYSIWDLTGYFGGIVTLFLGASVLTGAEFIHFVILEMYACFRKRASIEQFHRNPRITFWKKLNHI